LAALRFHAYGLAAHTQYGLAGGGQQVCQWNGTTSGSEDSPLPGYAPERVCTAVLEDNPGTVHEILDGPRHEDFACLGQGRDTGPDVDGDSANVGTANFTFAGMQTASDVDAQLWYALNQCGAAPNCARGAIEGGKKPVASVLHYAAVKVGDLGACDLVVAFEQLPPALVAEFCDAPGRIDDVGEQHGGQNPVRYVLVALSGQKLLDLAGDRLDVADRGP
jgi:hypothetical protein